MNELLLELLFEYIDAAVEYRVDVTLGRDTSFSWVAESQAKDKLTAYAKEIK